MKTIANCTAVEFIRQANKIRHEISKYLDVTKIMSISRFFLKYSYILMKASG